MDGAAINGDGGTLSENCDFGGQGIKNSSFLSLIYQLDIEG